MTLLQFLGYLSDAWVLVTYFVLTHTGKHTVAFHWANALGAAPILIAEVQLGAWQVLPLTGTFCAIGWLGLYKAWRARQRLRFVTPLVPWVKDTQEFPDASVWVPGLVDQPVTEYQRRIYARIARVQEQQRKYASDDPAQWDGR